jgi:hypothetical protein
MAIRMPKRTPPSSPEAFIAEASAALPSATQATDLPWLNPRVRADVRLQFNCKLPEPLVLKIEFLKTKLGRSKQDILEEALGTWVSKNLRNLDMPDS